MSAKTPEPVRCTATLELIEDQTIARLPADASASLPSRGQVAVTGSANGHDFSTVVEPDGRRGHWIRIDDALREAIAVEAGGTVELELTPTKEWPEPAVPEDLQAALDHAPDTEDVWSSITPMARWEWVRWVKATKNPQTRERRVDVTISKLRDGKRRPCCFDLSSCTEPALAKSGVLMGTE